LTEANIYLYPLEKPVPRQPNAIFFVDETLCYGCGACIALCPINVLELIDRLAVVDEPNCSHCLHCIPSCPVYALSIKDDYS
tara:strand:- start:750 stop:995 length:246 start_codon:yes stop_codon:yes gene_type:complete